MSTIEEIETAIEKLSDHDVAELKAWLWDREIESDAVTGRLDLLANEALSEYRAGKTRPLWRITPHRGSGTATMNCRRKSESGLISSLIY